MGHGCSYFCFQQSKYKRHSWGNCDNLNMNITLDFLRCVKGIVVVSLQIILRIRRNADIFINSCKFHNANHLPSNGTEKIGMGTYMGQVCSYIHRIYNQVNVCNYSYYYSPNFLYLTNVIKNEKKCVTKVKGKLILKMYRSLVI